MYRIPNLMEKMNLVAEKLSMTYSDVYDVVWYDWPNMDEHIKWLHNVSVDELADWVNVVVN